MRIGFDRSIVHINQAGSAIYAGSLFQALAQAVCAPDVMFPLEVKQRRDMAAPKTVRTRLDTLYRDLVWTHLVLPWQARRAKLSLLHMPANVVPAWSPCPTVVSILDTTIFQSPQNFPAWQRSYARVFTPLSARRAARIITISQQSKRDIVRQFGVPPEKVSVTYLGAAADFKPLPAVEIEAVRRQYGLDRFILTVGSLEPRKNIVRLLQALARLHQAGLRLPLVHAGPPGWLYGDILAEVERLGLKDSVRFLGRVPKSDLARLYNAAAVFAYPSLYEGFGLPVLEAMASGCPVITSSVSSLPEVAGEAAILVDPLEVDQLAGALQAVLDSPEQAGEMRRLGLIQAGLFSWERCAAETYQIYRSLI